MRTWGVKYFIRWVYQLIVSPAIHLAAGPGFGCRFIPTCSEYAKEAFELHGWMKGCRLSFWRICRCHPLARAGYDPVPRAIASTYSNPTRIQI